jgi:hypothetical protein
MLSSRFRAVKPFDATEGMASSLGKRKTPTELRVRPFLPLRRTACRLRAPGVPREAAN